MKSLLHSFALVFVSAAFCQGPALAHSAIEPVPRQDAWWQERHKGFLKRVAEVGEKARIIFIGDSITQGWEGEGKEVWAKYYGHRNAINLGIGGDRTQHVLWRLENGNLDGIKPKAAVVMIGTNNSNGEDNTAQQIVEGVTAIVKKLRSDLPETKVLLLAIFPRSENFSAQRGKILQVNQVLRKLADGQNVFWIDFGHRFVNSDGLIPRELMPDFLHLSPKGYQLWAEAIESRVSSILGDAPVKGAGAGARTANLSGEWIWTIRDESGNPVEAPLLLEVEGNTIRGKFSRGPDRWLEIESGKLDGNQVTWIVKRDRPDGTIMTYQMSGRLENGTILGTVTAEVDGSEITTDWSAKRK
jgi:beta-glucosidase